MMALVSGLGSNKTVLDLWKQPSWGEVQHSKFSVFFMDDAGGDAHEPKWSSPDEAQEGGQSNGPCSLRHNIMLEMST